MANRERLTKTLMDLIRIDSPTGEEDAVDREVSVRLQALGFQVYHDSFQNIIAKLDGRGEPVILSAHLDTVEPGRGITPVLEGEHPPVRRHHHSGWGLQGRHYHSAGSPHRGGRIGCPASAH